MYEGNQSMVWVFQWTGRFGVSVDLGVFGCCNGLACLGISVDRCVWRASSLSD